MRAYKNGWIIITGGGSGLGQALTWDIVGRGGRVIVAGRRQEALEETRARAPEAILTVAADVATPQGRDAVVQAAQERGPLYGVVHNAAVLDPVGPLAEIAPEDWRYQQAVNVEGPLFLTQALLPHMMHGGRILHISSGAAHRCLTGWGGYCSSKAALHMLYLCLREELAPRGVYVGSVRPGVVDTPMQTRIRATDASRFPGVERFRRLKAEGQLESSERVADFISWVLLDTGDRQFSEAEWDIGNESQTRLWRDTRAL